MSQSERTTPEDEPVLNQFLGLLAHDMTNHPERLQIVDVGLVTLINSLASNIEIDLDAPLSADDE